MSCSRPQHSYSDQSRTSDPRISNFKLRSSNMGLLIGEFQPPKVQEIREFGLNWLIDHYANFVMICAYINPLSTQWRILRGFGGSLQAPPPPPPVFKYPMKMKQFGLSKTKLFHFHGIFNSIKSAKQSLKPLYI